MIILTPPLPLSQHSAKLDLIFCPPCHCNYAMEEAGGKKRQPHSSISASCPTAFLRFFLAAALLSLAPQTCIYQPCPRPGPGPAEQAINAPRLLAHSRASHLSFDLFCCGVLLSPRSFPSADVQLFLSAENTLLSNPVSPESCYSISLPPLL